MTIEGMSMKRKTSMAGILKKNRTTPACAVIIPVYAGCRINRYGPESTIRYPSIFRTACE
jgi:hypothetical protein